MPPSLRCHLHQGLLPAYYMPTLVEQVNSVSNKPEDNTLSKRVAELVRSSIMHSVSQQMQKVVK